MPPSILYFGKILSLVIRKGKIFDGAESLACLFSEIRKNAELIITTRQLLSLETLSSIIFYAFSRKGTLALI